MYACLSVLPLAIFVSCSTGGSSDNINPIPPPGSSTTVALRAVVSGLDSPVAITHAGDDRLFVTLQPGRVAVLRNGQVLATPFLDISALVSSGGERGLLSVAFHPNFAGNGLFFVDYTDLAGDTVIARYRVSAADPDRADPASGVILLTIAQPFSNHNGGQLQFGPDGKLYIGMGDGGSGGDPQLNAQRDDTLLGKLLRIDVDSASNSPPFYAVPSDNPLFGGVRNEIWAKGLRNPWRFSFDRLTGDLYIGDVGQNGREEIDLQPRASRGGENYGWNVMEGRVCFSDAALSIGAPPCNDPRLTAPIIEYDHSQGNCSVTGGYVYRGTQVSGLSGAYLYGDFCSGNLWAARRNGSAWTVESLPPRATGLTTFGEALDGEMYLATSSGTLYRIVNQP